MPNNNKTIIVLGMHRSGTSLTAGILNILGVNMGDKLLSNDKFNPMGYYEDNFIMNLNNKILSSSGGSWDSPPKREAILNNNSSTPEIKKFLNNKSGLWGWKDPRTALTIELFIPYLKNPHFIVCLRNPYEVAKSLNERDGLNFITSLELYINYYKRIVDFFKIHPNLSKIFISFEKIIKNPIMQAKKISDFLDLEITSKKSNRIKKFIIPTEAIRETRERIQRNLEKQQQKKIIRLQQELQEIHNSRIWKLALFLQKMSTKITFLKKISSNNKN